MKGPGQLWFRGLQGRRGGHDNDRSSEPLARRTICQNISESVDFFSLPPMGGIGEGTIADLHTGNLAGKMLKKGSHAVNRQALAPNAASAP